MTQLFRALCACVLLAAVVSLPAMGQSYELNVLGTLGGVSAEAWDINNARQIVGKIDSHQIGTRAFLWEEDSAGLLEPSTVPATSWARRINESGVIVGERAGTLYDQVFLYEGSVNDIGAFGGLTCLSGGINNNGDIVANPGSYGTYSTLIRYQNGTTENIQPLVTGKSIRGNDINDNGVVVGIAQSSDLEPSGSNRWHAWVYRNGETEDIDTFGSIGSTSDAINNAGLVVGSWTAADYVTSIFTWQDGVGADLGNMGGAGIWAYDINEAGEFVGQSESAIGFSTAFVYRNGSFHALSDLGYGAAALGINDNGWIVGYVITTDGARQAAYWTAVPEPSSIIALICGIAGLGGVIRRKKL